jgi:hypothetical protein
MSRKDSEIRAAIQDILEDDFPGARLKKYFDGLPDTHVKRAIHVLSAMYPDKTAIPDRDFRFIMDLFSDVKFVGQDSFPEFVRAVNVVDFTEFQKRQFVCAIKRNMGLLCAKCTYELDALLARLFEPDALIRYLEVLAEEGNRPVLQHVSDILRHGDFSGGRVPGEKIEMLKEKVAKSLNRE